MHAPDARADRLDRFLAHPRKAVWTLAVPMMAGMLFHAAYSILNAVFVGSLGSEALAAVTFVGPVFFVAMALSEGLASGVTAVIAQAIGRGDGGEADRAASSSLLLGLAIGATLAVAGHLAGPRLLELLGAEGATVDQAWAYFQVLVWGIPLFFVTATFRAVLTGEGDTRTPMIVMLVATVLNGLLDAAYIFGLGLGIRGAGFATLTGQVLSLGVFAWLLAVRRRRTSPGGGRSLLRAVLSPDAAVLRRVLSIGVPNASAQLVMSAGMMLGNRLLSTFGQTIVAAFGAASRVDMVVAMPVMGLAGASVAVIGMFAGAGRADLVRSTTLYAGRWALTLTAALGLSTWIASHSVMRLFTTDPEAIAIGRMYLGYMVFAYPMMALGMTSSRILQGLGLGVPSLVITSLRIGVGVGLGYVAVYVLHGPVQAVWACFITGGVLSVIVALTWVWRAIWRADPTLRARRAAVAVQAS